MKKLSLALLLFIVLSCSTIDIKPYSHENLNTSLVRESHKNAKVFFSNLSDNQVVSSPVHIKFGVKNMSIVPAGKDIPYSGHHHLLVDVNKLPTLVNPLPASKNIIHFGKGQTETKLKLSKGKHTLQLLLANFVHVPHVPAVKSKRITIIVK